MAYGTVNADLMTTSDGVSSSGLYGFKNRIINGAMVIDQRNAGASVTVLTTTNYLLDRWYVVASQSSKFSVQQNAGSVTPPVGFINYLGVTSLSAYSVGASESFSVRQIVEGLNVADFGWGTINAQPITVSFWVRSSLTGTFGFGLGNNGFSRAYAAAYTINSANTWEYKTITIAGDTSGTWLTTNGIGISAVFCLGYGSSLLGTAGVWNAGTYYQPTGATSVVGTNGATFYITGVQLEKGSTATSFDYRPYGTELQLCQRYFCKSAPIGTAILSSGLGSFVSSAVEVTTTFPVLMRTTPTVTVYDSVPTTNKFNYYSGGWQSGGTVNTASANSEFMLDLNSANANWRCNYYASAEL